MGLVFAAGIVLLLRFIQPERLMRVESLPDITDFFATLQSPITPMLPSFWAGEALFAGIQGGVDWLHQAALWTTAGAFTVVLAGAHARWHFAGYSRSQEAPKTRFAKFRSLDAVAAGLPLSAVRRQLLVKDVKVFLRDVSQWVQLLPLLALVLLYLYNFQVLDLERMPFVGGFVKNIYAFVNLGMAGFVMATVAVRFVFPAVSAEGSTSTGTFPGPTPYAGVPDEYAARTIPLPPVERITAVRPTPEQDVARRPDPMAIRSTARRSHCTVVGLLIREPPSERGSAPPGRETPSAGSAS